MKKTQCPLRNSFPFFYQSLLPILTVINKQMSDLFTIDEPGYVRCWEGAGTETGDVDGVARLVVREESRDEGPALGRD